MQQTAGCAFCAPCFSAYKGGPWKCCHIACMSSLDTCLTPAHVHTLFVSYPPLKLQPTGTFSNCFFSAPFLASLREHRTTFESILDVTSPILAFSYPQSISGGRGTGPCSPASMMPKNKKTRRSGRFGLPNWEM